MGGFLEQILGLENVFEVLQKSTYNHVKLSTRILPIRICDLNLSRVTSN